MTDKRCLEDLELAELGVAVHSFRNLFYHRTVLLEGIRRVAVRNMAHLTDARRRCNAQGSLRVGEDWVPRVQATMLNDQGLNDNGQNRTVIAWATFYPLYVYLALLYAETDYARGLRERSRFVQDDEFFTYLDKEQKAVTKLRGFRDSFLHPKSEGTRLETDYLAYGPSYNAAPEIQAALDGFLARLNARLDKSLSDVVARLPRVARLHCVAQALLKTFDRMNLHHDLEGLERVAAQMKEFESEVEDTLDEYKSWAPTPRQASVVLTLAEYKSEVLPSAKELQTEIPSVRQPPMNHVLLAPLFSGSGDPERLGSSRAAKHVVRNAAFIRRLLIAAAVMTNEAATWQGKQSWEELLSPVPRAAVPDVQETGLHDAALIAAPSRLSAALLYEPLRLYSEMERQDPSVRDAVLSGLVASLQEPLRHFRNSVFHVPDHTNHPERFDHDAVGALQGTIDTFYSGLVAFFGPGLVPDDADPVPKANPLDAFA